MSRNKKSNVCNICGYPAKISYREQDQDTGQMVEKFHIVPCTGHPGVHPFLWNRSGQNLVDAAQEFMKTRVFDDYQKYIVKKKKQCNKTSNKRKKSD